IPGFPANASCGAVIATLVDLLDDDAAAGGPAGGDDAADANPCAGLAAMLADAIPGFPENASCAAVIATLADLLDDDAAAGGPAGGDDAADANPCADLAAMLADAIPGFPANASCGAVIATLVDLLDDDAAAVGPAGGANADANPCADLAAMLADAIPGLSADASCAEVIEALSDESGDLADEDLLAVLFAGLSDEGPGPDGPDGAVESGGGEDGSGVGEQVASAGTARDGTEGVAAVEQERGSTRRGFPLSVTGAAGMVLWGGIALLLIAAGALLLRGRSHLNSRRDFRG
ncbi:MAG TPA: hypothetical protein VM573_01805, partial [Actinomycetota bacterium]|nr:hypothetical protein [Actinomycetota bacterium]